MADASPFEWYDYKAVLSHNALWSIVSGPRSIGKTFGAKRDMVKRFLKNGSQTIWVRRTHTELTPAKARFFDGVAPLWPGFEFRIEGPTGQVRIEDGEWQTVCHFIALSTSAQVKGTEFPEVDWIVYDECFPDPGQRELVDEVGRMRNLWITVNRSRVDAKGRATTRVLLLGNVTSFDNCWFLEWYFDAGKEWQKGRDTGGDVVLHLVDAKKYERRVDHTTYGSVLGERALGYAEGDYFLPDGGYIVDARPENSRPYATLVSERGTFGLWVSADYLKMYVTTGPLADKALPVVTFEAMSVRPGIPLADATTRIRKITRRHYRSGTLFLVGPAAMAARKTLAS